MPRPAQSDKQIAQKKAAIVDAAAEIFSRRGIAATSMDHVAAKLGWAKGTLYNYFPTRDDLIMAVLLWLIKQQTDALEWFEAQPHASASQTMIEYLEGMLAMRSQMKQLFNLSMELWAAAIADREKSQLKTRFGAVYKINCEFLGRVLAGGQASGEFRGDFEPRAMASLFFGAWDGLLFQAWLDPNFDIQTPARQHLQALLRGLAKSLIKPAIQE